MYWMCVDEQSFRRLKWIWIFETAMLSVVIDRVQCKCDQPKLKFRRSNQNRWLECTAYAVALQCLCSNVRNVNIVRVWLHRIGVSAIYMSQKCTTIFLVIQSFRITNMREPFLRISKSFLKIPCDWWKRFYSSSSMNEEFSWEKKDKIRLKRK